MTAKQQITDAIVAFTLGLTLINVLVNWWPQ